MKSESAVTAPALDARTRTGMLAKMMEIRYAEEAIQGLFLENLVRGSTHLCIGQEACSAGIAWARTPGDTITCTYRGHGHALAWGMSLKSLIAELMGKASGACKGKGGSMHLTDASIGLLGLPVLFICENNLYGEYSPLAHTTPVTDLADRAVSYGMPGIIVDGQDVETVYHEVCAAADRARSGAGPSLIELKTYRYKGHSRTDPATYRAPGELDRWMQRDPIVLLANKMQADKQIDDAQLEKMKQDTQRTVADAVAWAKAGSCSGKMSPWRAACSR